MRFYSTIIKILLIVIFVPHLAAKNSGTVAVFYPNSKEPYRSIYQQIIEGISSSKKNDVKLFLLEVDFDREEILSKLRANKITKVVVLGRAGYHLAKELPKEFHVVSGALPISPNGVSGISLISNPRALFKYLNVVAPKVNKIHIAYSESSAWLIKSAKQAALDKGLTLNAVKVNTTAEAIQFYDSLFQNADPAKDAIWLPLDKITSHDKVTLPMILEKAWTHEFVVFSSKPSHAKRGALFSTYPDNFLLGKRLTELVNELDSNNLDKKFETLEDLQLAVNLRTAAHLGISYDSETEKQFKLTFPE